MRELGTSLQPLVVQRDGIHIDERQERLPEHATSDFLRLLEVIGEIGQVCAQLTEETAVVGVHIGEEERRPSFRNRQVA